MKGRFGGDDRAAQNRKRPGCSCFSWGSGFVRATHNLSRSGLECSQGKYRCPDARFVHPTVVLRHRISAREIPRPAVAPHFREPTETQKSSCGYAHLSRPETMRVKVKGQKSLYHCTHLSTLLYIIKYIIFSLYLPTFYFYSIECSHPPRVSMPVASASCSRRATSSFVSTILAAAAASMT